MDFRQLDFRRPKLRPIIQERMAKLYSLTYDQLFGLGEMVSGLTLRLASKQKARALPIRAARLAFTLLFRESWQSLPVEAALKAGFILLQSEGGLALNDGMPALADGVKEISEIDRDIAAEWGARLNTPQALRRDRYWAPLEKLYSVHCVCEWEGAVVYRGTISCHDGGRTRDPNFPLPVADYPLG